MRESLKLYTCKDDKMILEQLQMANSFGRRFVGLMGKTLEETEGLMIQPCNSIHCFFMKISIDVLFLDDELNVIHKIEGMKPWRISPIIKGARSVVEASEGAFEGIELGDKVYLA